ncbi:MAG: baseplate J/gp47 family protein, partial [Firmicutes bacterium]|nr:baseplate J/gp47 family protein [Bacillota bacterium]
DNFYELECEQVGSQPNAYIGHMAPLEYLNGLSKAELERILVPGEDEEGTEAFRARYLKDLLEQSFGGNVADYVNKAEGIAGVGAAKVQAAWQGGGTVKLILLNEKLGVPDSALVQRVQMLFDPSPTQGAGLGLAPIGHVVTVAAAKAKSVAVGLQVSLREGWQLADVQAAVAGCIDEYFADLAADWSAAAYLTVRVSQLEARILQLNGVLDVSGLTFNGRAANLLLAADEIPVRGQVVVR